MIGKMMGALGLALGITLLVPALALGHADYDHSTPNDGETVTTSPSRVDAYFTADMDTSGTNSLNVKNSSGADVDNNDATVDSADATHMSITLQSGLANGTYTVEWATLSAEDGEEDSGTFSFTVQVPSGTTPVGGATPAPGAPTTGYGQQGEHEGSGILTALVLALIGIGGTAMGASLVLRGRGRPA